MKIYKLTAQHRFQLAIALALIMFGASYRLMPHPANVAPIAATALLAGAILPRRLALTVPLASMILSDIVIGLHPTIAYTWGAFGLVAVVSSYRFKNLTASTVAISSIGASTLFYLVSNFGVFVEGRLYTHTLSGFVHCYVNALPFFRNTLVGDFLFTATLFVVYACITEASKMRVQKFQRAQ